MTRKGYLRSQVSGSADGFVVTVQLMVANDANLMIQ